MGGSYRSDLKSGWMREWGAPLREVVEKLTDVRSQVYDCIGSDGQYDNAGEDGGLAEVLGICIALIKKELPDATPKPNPKP